MFIGYIFIWSLISYVKGKKSKNTVFFQSNVQLFGKELLCWQGSKNHPILQKAWHYIAEVNNQLFTSYIFCAEIGRMQETT